MCMLTVFPMPDLLDADMIERLENGAAVNDDGHGFAVVVGRQIHTGHNLDRKQAIAQFAEAYEQATGPALFHSRWATHGAVTEFNCHPFPVRKFTDTYLAHNGIMPAEAIPDKGDPRPDTRVFADDILPRRFSRLDSRKVRGHLSTWLGGNKVAILTTNRRYRRNLYLFNAGLGEWVDGVWFSNSDYDGTWSRYLASKYGTVNAEPENCILCGMYAVNAWAICTSCQTCQDCLEVQSECLCYLPSHKEADDDPDQWPSVLYPTGSTVEKGKEIVPAWTMNPFGEVSRPDTAESK